MTRLPELIVSRIRQTYKSEDITQTELAKRYKISVPQCHNILMNNSYKDKFYIPPKRTPVDIEYVRQLRTHNLSYAKCAKPEQEHSGRPVAFTGEYLRKLCKKSRSCGVRGL